MQKNRQVRWQDLSRWDDLQVNPSSVKLPSSGAPSWESFRGSYVLAFSGSATNSIYFTAQVPHSYEEGTDMDFHIHYVPEDNTAGNVVWQFTYSWASIGALFPVTTNVEKILATPEVEFQHTLGDIADLDGTDKGISSILTCCLQRVGNDGDDTYNSKDIYLVGLDFHFQKDSIGSREEGVK